MKKLILFLLIVTFYTSAEAQILTGEIKYDCQQAKEEAFREPPKQIDFDFIKIHFIDKNRNENINALQSGIDKLINRKLAKFSDGSYGVEYFDDPEYSWYYDSMGRLINFTHKSALTYPCKTTKYKPDGSITNTGLKVSEKESFLFNKDGKLIAHWLGDYCYDAKNNIIMTRKNIQ